MTQPLITVLLPTRGRAHLLERSIGSLLERATRPDRVRVRCGVDDDDAATIQQLARMGIGEPELWVTQRLGYGMLHEYVNVMARASGSECDWFLLWNDDALMLTQGWDSVVDRFDPSYVLDCWSNHEPLTCAFPIVPAQWVRWVGHFSLNPHNDSWWQYIAGWLHRLVRVEIDVQHNRYDLTGMNDDQTYAEKLAHHATQQFYDGPTDMLMKQDRDTIMQRLVQARNRRIRGKG